MTLLSFFLNIVSIVSVFALLEGYSMGETKLKTQKIAKLEQFIRDDVFKISGRQLPEEFFEDETTKGRIWHFLMQESEY